MRADRNILTAWALNTAFCTAEFVVGTWTGSVAILSDAVHDLGDSLALGLAWYLQRLSARNRDAKYSYGYRRFSILGAVVNSVVLLVGAGVMVREALFRLTSDELPHADGMAAFALLGIAVNGYAAVRLRTGKSLNERTLALHLFDDVLGWVAVLIVGITLKFVALPWLDPLLSLAFSAFIVRNAVKNLGEGMNIFLQSTPKGLDEARIRSAILAVEGVKAVHDLHLWTLDGEYHVASVHVVIAPPDSFPSTRILTHEIRRRLKSMGLQHLTIEIEVHDEFYHSSVSGD
jgi:cobalt-zinc-cadmium efflux system protein